VAGAFAQLQNDSREAPHLAISERCYVMEKGRIVSAIAPGEVTADNVRQHLLI
jgi:ABC-type branched-subunit amino acid transport system ATPase component